MVKAKTFHLDNDNANYYYIHRHIDHFEKDDAVTFFQEQKDVNFQLMKSMYRQNYLNSINEPSRQSLEMLNNAMNEDEFISGLDKELLNVLNGSVAEAIQEYDFSTKIKTAYSSLNKFINTQDAKSLDKIFTQITNATKLLTSNKNEIVFLTSVKQQYRNNRDLSTLYQYIQNTLPQWDGKMLRMNPATLQSVNNSLMSLVRDLSQNRFNRQVLQGYLKNIFSTQIGEYLISKGIGKGLQLLPSEITHSLSGSRNVEVTADEELKQLISEYGQKGNQVFKTDNSFKDVSIEISSGENVNINLGISTKWYKGNSSGNVSDVAVTTETSFVHRLNQMLKSSTEFYYAYNALALAGQDNEAYAALKSALVARNLSVLMSGLGVQGDFAQFLVVNGKFYSIWDIINAVEHFNKGQGSFDAGDKTDPVTISATGLSEVISLTEQAQDQPNDLIKAFVRAKQQNILIQNLGLSGHFYPNRLRNALLSNKG